MRIFTLVILTLLISQSLFAQSTKDELFQDFSDHICTCVNEELDFVDDDVRQVFIDLEDKTEAEADEYFMGLEPSLLNKIVTQAELVSNESTSTGISNCITDFEDELTDDDLLTMGINPDDDKSFDAAMLDILNLMTAEECEFSRSIIMTGLKAQ
jgi:hypothetical protein